MSEKPSPEDDKRDAVLRRMAKLPPMTQAELAEKLRRERAEKKGRGPKPAPEEG